MTVVPLRQPAPRAHRSQPIGYGFTASLLTLVFAGLMPIYLMTTIPYPTDQAVVGDAVLALIILVYSGTRLAFVIGRGLPTLFAFAFWLFVYVFLAVPAFAQVLASRSPGTTPDINLEYNTESLVIILLGLVATEVGALFVSRRTGPTTPGVSSRSRRASPVPREFSRARITLLALGGFAMWVFYVARIGPATFFTSRESMALMRGVVFPEPTLSTIIAASASIPLLVCVHAMARYRRAEVAAGIAKRSFTLMMPMAAFAVVFAINVFSSSRYLFGTMAFSLLVLIGAFATRARIRWTMSILTGVLLFGFPLFSIFRREATQTSSQLGAGAFVNSGDYDSFAQINNAVNYVSVEGILWGKQLLGPLVFWVPRSIWPDKPIDTGVFIAQFRGYRFENLSAPFWAEAYLSGGWAGLVILFVLLGFILKKADRTTQFDLATSGVSGVAVAILSFYLLILLRGSLLQATSMLAVMVFSIWFVSRRGTPEARTTGDRRGLIRAQEFPRM